MRDHDRYYTKMMPVENRLNILDLVARIDDNRFARRFVPEDRAIALQHPHWKNFVNHRN
jgi:uncharacterized membrane protein YfbV (UPF0208 family)